MTEQLFLQFPDTMSEQLLWFHTEEGQIKQRGVQALNTLDELTAQFQSLPVIVLVPSTDCLVTRIALPTKQRRQQIKAIPYALEEQLADDLESLHFATGKRGEDGQLPVIAVSKNKMEDWLTILNEAEISPAAMLPSSALLEAPEDAWSIFQQGEKFMVNQQGNCWTASAEAAATMLQLSLNKINEQELPGLLYWGKDEIPAWIVGLGLECSAQRLQDPEQALLARFDPQNINLLQGDFEVQNDWKAGWQVWRRVAISTTLIILLKFSMMGFDLFSLSEEQQYLKNEMARTYLQVAPGARLVNPEQQMRLLLKKQIGGQFQSGSFLVMLGKVAEELAAIPDIQATNLNYNSNKSEIRLDLLVANLPLLDQLKERLGRKGLSIEIGAANAQGNSYSGRLIIRSGL